MSYNAIGAGVLVVVTIAVIALGIRLASEVTEQVYDCSIAEFHPDYPKEVKQKCRELRRKTSVET